ncbi:alkaline shock response membrane anchor protein AmaP [Lentzea sp. BCCO 10_0798]|uniref:Alkaline shock response membrane anchor protein AmaP n=1 Tax=Lentzea kristufekii TaxID=3095430 RepID=A0ABU4TRR8_9PSEU|nr:alkaline shock response membrane anchor protein AmaP [Lentzea sp. BCCO 10_0798]MDX8050978.1 alkaline shock response membrane anchor protein AmaP [Lentzea sp. BCCO 10_0798]
MTGPRRPARLNRTLLATIGIALLAVGGFTLATHFRVLHLVDPGAPVVPGVDPPPTWALYATAATAILLGLLALRWLLAQAVRGPRSPTWREDTGLGHTELSASTAIAPLAEELRTYPGVHDARATLTGPRDAPELALIIVIEQDADPADVRHQLEDEGLPRLRQALELDTVPTDIEFRFATATTRSLR